MTTSADGRRLQAAFGDMLVRLAGERPGLLLVTGPDATAVTSFADIWPERLLTVTPPATRLSVAQGVRLGGGEAIVLLDEHVTALQAPASAPVLLLSVDPSHLALAFRAGLTVCQPSTPQDIAALLIGSLGADESVLLHLPPAIDPPATEDLARCEFGQPRVLHEGRGGLLVGAGATARVAGRLAALLDAQGLALTAVEAHTLTADSRVDVAMTIDHVLVGPLDAPRAGALTPVPVTFDDLAVTAQAVSAVLTRRSPRRSG